MEDKILIIEYVIIRSCIQFYHHFKEIKQSIIVNVLSSHEDYNGDLIKILFKLFLFYPYDKLLIFFLKYYFY